MVSGARQRSRVVSHDRSAGSCQWMTAARSIVAGRYRLLQPLGQGGMGRIWLATDDVLHRPVAVKEVVPAEGLTAADLEEMLPRTLREARTAARLNHPNVVRVYDIVVADGAPWIVMEYLPSRSLYQIVTTDGPMPPARAAHIGLGVLAALRAAHRVGVLHRDVKPGNVLIADDGRVVLTDFGLATIIGDPSVTRAGVVLGSPSFMAPERAAEAAGGAESDLWSLGATLYFAVEGRSPYERISTLATLAALASEDPPRSNRSGALWPVLAGLLRRDPRARWDAATVERALRGIAGPSPAPKTAVVTPPPSLPNSGRATVAALAALALVLTVAALVLWGGADRPGGQGRAASPPAAAVGASAGPQLASPSPSAPPPTFVPSPAALVLPPGWHIYTDGTGFSVAVPASWPVTREGTMVYFREPGGAKVLGIDQTDQPKPDPVADWTGKEQYRVARGDFPGYRRVRMAEVDYFIKAADWEFTYLRGGSRVHVNNRGFITSPNRAYGMWWSTADSRWAQYLPDLRLIQRSFRPAG
jgi:hypothetical protein